MMEPLERGDYWQQQIWTFDYGTKKASVSSCLALRMSEPHFVETFVDLATKVAELQFRDHDFVQLLRSQTTNYRDKNGNTALKPANAWTRAEQISQFEGARMTFWKKDSSFPIITRDARYRKKGR